MLINGLFSGLSTTAFFIWLGIFIIVIAGGGFAFYLFRLRSKMMAETPTSRIRAVKSGYVEFEGRVRAMSASALKGVLTGTPCAWYEYEITQQMGGHGSNRHSQWVNVDKSNSDDVFWLVDETGQCLIDPQGAKVITAPEQTDRWLGRTARPNSGPEKRSSRFGLFPGQGFSSFNFSNGLWFSTRQNYRYLERRIPEGAPLYVIGQFKKMGNGAGDNNASVSELLRSWKSNQKEMLDRFDSDGDGRIDADEWEAARKTAESEVKQHDPQPAGKEISVLGASGDRSKPFLISAISQSELLGRYRLLGNVGIAAAITGTLMLGLLIAGR
jgi:hypothetical protein